MIHAAPETAVALLSIVDPDLDAVPHMRAFAQFVAAKEGLKRITQDEVCLQFIVDATLNVCCIACCACFQWNQLLSFSRSVKSDLSNYDDSAACKLICCELLGVLVSSMSIGSFPRATSDG